MDTRLENLQYIHSACFRVAVAGRQGVNDGTILFAFPAVVLDDDAPSAPSASALLIYRAPHMPLFSAAGPMQCGLLSEPAKSRGASHFRK